MLVRDEIVTIEEQHDLDNKGIAKNAREEKTRARDAKQKQTEEDARMAKLYRQHILKEAAGPELVSIAPIAAAPAPKPAPAPKKVEEQEEVGSFGD
jgi:hypothetical protein